MNGAWPMISRRVVLHHDDDHVADDGPSCAPSGRTPRGARTGGARRGRQGCRGRDRGQRSCQSCASPHLDVRATGRDRGDSQGSSKRSGKDQTTDLRPRRPATCSARSGWPAIGISLRHSGQGRVVGDSVGAAARRAVEHVQRLHDEEEDRRRDAEKRDHGVQEVAVEERALVDREVQVGEARACRRSPRSSGVMMSATKRGHDRAEGNANDDRDRQVDHVPAHDELLELPQHGCPPLLGFPVDRGGYPTPMMARMDGRVVILGGGSTGEAAAGALRTLEPETPITLVEAGPRRRRVLVLRLHAVEGAAAPARGASPRPGSCPGPPRRSPARSTSSGRSGTAIRSPAAWTTRARRSGWPTATSSSCAGARGWRGPAVVEVGDRTIEFGRHPDRDRLGADDPAHPWARRGGALDEPRGDVDPRGARPR